jgi:hypothetical protein
MIALTILCLTAYVEAVLAYLHAIRRAEAAYLAMYDLGGAP